LGEAVAPVRYETNVVRYKGEGDEAARVLVQFVAEVAVVLWVLKQRELAPSMLVRKSTKHTHIKRERESNREPYQLETR
jgi:hypothetical protein